MCRVIRQERFADTPTELMELEIRDASRAASELRQAGCYPAEQSFLRYAAMIRDHLKGRMDKTEAVNGIAPAIAAAIRAELPKQDGGE
jgi:hypothetical protein